MVRIRSVEKEILNCDTCRDSNKEPQIVIMNQFHVVKKFGLIGFNGVRGRQFHVLSSNYSASGGG